MPKTKRWQNLQKPVQSLPISQGVAQPTLPVQENAQPPPLIQAASQSTSSKSRPHHSRHHPGIVLDGNLILRWTVDAIVQSLPTSQGVAQSTLPVQAHAQPTPSIQATRRLASLSRGLIMLSINFMCNL
ncbi:uncharacterized protein LOC132067840 [Lycium ferocissimum]|uniref:uncharacterized protein LOC132067840 n=1 Tax=Lycium ferocissimum TaxID=112874 RepID=UPI0028164A3F|nr:uncharacterized protein LOC132067840 [Lycium ferocissimum]